MNIYFKKIRLIKISLAIRFLVSFLTIGICFANDIYAQNITIDARNESVSGVITDATGEPLPGVNVVIKGTQIGVVTDATGKFSINVPNQDAVLQFSFVGYATQEVAVGNQSRIDITLTENSQALEEVVVVGYGIQKKVNLTGSVSSVSAAELVNKPVANTSQALAGLVSGLSVVQSSGRPNTGATVRIRGTGTFSSAGNEPLVLIDGFSGGINDVNPDDIQNISFLKDAASASIYGNRAANGVILIETKKGTEGKIKITYSNSFGWQKPTELPDFLPSWEYATYYNEAMSNMGRPDAYSPEQIQKFRDGSDPDNYPNVNHLKWLVTSGSGFQQRHSVGIQGGTASTTYNISVGYWDQDGMTQRTNYKKYSALLSLKTQISKSLTFNTNINAYADNYKSPGGIDGLIGMIVRQGPIIPGQKSDGTFGFIENMGAEAQLASTSFDSSLGRNINASGQLVWETPIPGLNLSGRAGVKYFSNFVKGYAANVYFDDTKSVGPASLNVTTNDQVYQTFEALVTYNKKIDAHTISVLGGTSSEESANRQLTAKRTTFPNNYLYELTSGDAATSTNDGSLNEYALLSFFGRINYSFNDRYLFEANLRYDGSSRFAKKSRWGLFPSVSAAWRISEESFWNDSNLGEIINQLKLRVSHGVLGNQNIGNYPYQQTYALGQGYPFGTPLSLTPGARITTFNNPDITWETTTDTDFGLDLSLLNGKWNATVNYFNKYTDDILSAVQVTSIMGRTVGQSNIGAVSNKGIEIELSYNGKIGHDFKFSIAPNFTYVKNAVEELADGTKEDINNNRIVGQPLGIIYGYTTDGLFVDQAEIDQAPNQLVNKVNLSPGYVKYVDINGPNGVPDGIVNANYDRSVIGCTTPKYYYGLNLSASYKGFDFSALLQGLGGHQMLTDYFNGYAFYNSGQIQRWQADNRWTKDNPNKWAEYPRIETMMSAHPNNQKSTYWLREASYLRIKNVQLGYTLPKRITMKFHAENVRIYISGQNLHSFNSYYKGWDPEVGYSGVQNGSFYPINSIWSFGLNVRF
jgi:TonB-linked SusC/RagA family outer membrane protein